MDSEFKNAKEALDTAKSAIDYLTRKWKPSFATEEEDWEDFKREEQLHDAIEEERQKAKEQEITIEQVRPVLAEISRNGKTAQVKELLKKYGANKLSEVKQEDLKHLLKDAEGIK